MIIDSVMKWNDINYNLTFTCSVIEAKRLIAMCYKMKWMPPIKALASRVREKELTKLESQTAIIIGIVW